MSDLDALRDAIDFLDAAMDATHPEGHGCDICRAADELRDLIEPDEGGTPDASHLLALLDAQTPATGLREALEQAEKAITAMGVVVAPGAVGRPVDMALMGQRIAEVVNLIPAIRAALAAAPLAERTEPR